VSEQKAEEAKLIKARQEGFQAALGLLNVEPSAGNAVSEEDRERSADRCGRDERASDPQELARHRGRRPIRQLIARELSFSGQPMTAAQIARAIDYNPERTETALARMEKDGQVFRNEDRRWTIGLAALTRLNGHAAAPSNGEDAVAPA